MKDKDAAIERLTREFADGNPDFLDGITCNYEDWWFNVRKSNTEPLLRVVIEADTDKTLEAARKKVVSVIEA